MLDDPDPPVLVAGPQVDEASEHAPAAEAAQPPLVLNDGLPEEQLPAIVRGYLATASATPGVDPEKVRRGEELFGLYGPEILMVLGFYSLPASYAARKGVQVLYRTGYLLHRPIRRAFETTQMVVDVMAEGGLAPQGRGVRSVQKVRLMHAAVRHLVRSDPTNPWDDALGLPVNQEDSAGTLMDFSTILLDGLARLGIRLSEADQEAWLHAWQAVGRLMGLREELIPGTLAEARALTGLIHQRQIEVSPEGRALTAALVEGYQKLLPGKHLEGVPASLIHFFLDRDPFSGQNIADMLGVPPADWTESAARLTGVVGEWVGRLGLASSFVAHEISFVSRHLMEAMLLVKRGGRRAPFFIPHHLLRRWQVGSHR